MLKKQILWILPNYNFYNIQRLNLLNSYFDILVIAGKHNVKLGFESENIVSKSKVIYANKHKESFGQSFQVVKFILNNLKGKDFVYIAVEKKNFLLLLIVLIYKFLFNSKFQIFSYNHLSMKSGYSWMSSIDKWLTKFYFKKLDRIIFYTQESCELAIERKMIISKNAYWANNTIDTTEVKKHYTYVSPPTEFLSILFIGRLIPTKRIGDLIKYFEALSDVLNDLKLEIIGNGPDNKIVEEAVLQNKNITWHGTLVDEAKIAPIMKRASLVFVPGLSGLSINHAFAYGRPYITLQADKHGPELNYIDDGKNGYVLDGDFESNLNTIKDLLTDPIKLKQFCNNARLKGNYLSVQNWVNQIKASLLDE